MYKIYNEDCLEGMKRIEDNSVRLVFTDPPYGIEGETLDKHYARDESFTIPGYVDVPKKDYSAFSKKWIKECERVLMPGGSIYIVSGYTGLRDILNALAETTLEQVNHLIGEYTFGVSTKKKWVSSHYHILYFAKPPIKDRVFNTYCRFTDIGDSYTDRISVQKLKRDYKPKQKKNKNQLPKDFVQKFILYSSNEGDVVLDPFMGGFTTAFAALEAGREVLGFELNKNAFEYFYPQLESVSKKETIPISPTEDVLKKRLKKRKGYTRK